MAAGTIKINMSTENGAFPVGGVSYAAKSKDGQVLYSGITNENGESGTYTLETRPASDSLVKNPPCRPYAVYDVWLGVPGYAAMNILDIPVFEGQETILPVDMIPVPEGEDGEYTFETPPPSAAFPTPVQTPAVSVPGKTCSAVTVPEDITVHMGRPEDASAPNITVKFTDYIKTAASSQIYPTWPVNSVIANILSITSLALNRICTGRYRSRGFPFDITSSDQDFVPGPVFQNISQLTDGIFNVYAARKDSQVPYNTEHCNGTTADCTGLSQWGTVALAEKGLSPLEILTQYYPKDLILRTATASGITEPYPGSAVVYGGAGEDVRTIQEKLNRIGGNYPLIPKITSPDGRFGTDTENAVRTFQRTFNLLQDGTVGRSTWNAISSVFNSVSNTVGRN